ncbi:Putative ribosome biogenesis protein Nop16 [Septoria linicola]|uniref:Nucleolar protein 16 n=1 Tax=Septoria linicola TaxID=215465 RepID=A0A9Q9AIR4_9PEZI|nr:putative ribosome biogenesis protein Nop16 [Septoria linicola]USW46933.1 Putative ribosome biogenesis protein Nop16 [Septoria linicola]
MGRELQKRKNRSGVQKVRQKPKSKKRVLTNPIIAANWDQSLTLAQNYKKLGLAAKLNKFTGGTEKKVSDLRHQQRHTEDDEEWEGLDDEADAVDPLNITTTSNRKKQQLNLAEAKIERDPETGAILRIIEQPDLPRSNPLNDPLAEFDSDDASSHQDDQVFSLQNQHANTGTPASSTSAKTDTVRALEAQASRPAAKYKRRQPEGEVAFIEELVKKHGDDYGKMARDMKVNYMQRSEGDLKKRIKTWREAGGRV